MLHSCATLTLASASSRSNSPVQAQFPCPTSLRNELAADESMIGEDCMEKEQVTGKLDELKGRLNQGIGKTTDDPGLQGEASSMRRQEN